MPTNLKRIINFAVSDFSRNRGISIATMFVLVITIMLVTGLFFFQGITGYLTTQVQDKIDITAYFNSNAQEQDILNVKSQIQKMSPEIKSIEYVSQDQALAAFSAKHADSPVLTNAIQQVGDNPFEASLNVTTNGSPAQYEQVANILQSSDFSKFIDKVDYSQKKDTIEKIYSITSRINLYGMILGILLVIVAMLVVFNTLKLAIENSKTEISTMRIVGASDWFVRGPFMIQGIIYGLISFIICFVLSGLLAWGVSGSLSVMLPGFSAIGYFLTNAWIFVLIQLCFGIGVGVVSSYIVVKKYLEV